jgi:hypothetical protein
MTTLLEYEPFIDTATMLFMERLDGLYASTGQICERVGNAYLKEEHRVLVVPLIENSSEKK